MRGAAFLATSNYDCESQPLASQILSKSNLLLSKSHPQAKIQTGSRDNVYVSKSYDATSHFETAARDVMDMWKRIHGGQELTLTVHPSAEA